MARRSLTEEEWRRVFDLRCRAKRGEHLSPENFRLVRDAYASDAARYKALDGPVFDATVPFGSAAKWSDFHG